MAVGIRAFNCTLMGEHVHSREGGPGFKPHFAQILAKPFCPAPATLEECPFEGTSYDCFRKVSTVEEASMKR